MVAVYRELYALARHYDSIGNEPEYTCCLKAIAACRIEQRKAKPIWQMS